MLLQMWDIIWILFLGSCLDEEGKWDLVVIFAPLLSLGNVHVQITCLIPFAQPVNHYHLLKQTKECQHKRAQPAQLLCLVRQQLHFRRKPQHKEGSQVPCSICEAVSFKTSGLPWQHHSSVGIRTTKTTESYCVFLSVCQVANINCNVGPYLSSHNTLAYFFVPRMSGMRRLLGKSSV